MRFWFIYVCDESWKVCALGSVDCLIQIHRMFEIPLELEGNKREQFNVILDETQALLMKRIILMLNEGLWLCSEEIQQEHNH